MRSTSMAAMVKGAFDGRVMAAVAISLFVHSQLVISATVEETKSPALPLVIDRHGASLLFDGIGGLSGGGATSRLLVDYGPPERGQILDYLFLPGFGASLQILKVEIGGDSVAGCGAESSHMHSESAVDYKTGYEWWLMTEAKRRNPDIKLYGLPWSFPAWVGGGSKSPFTYPNKTALYIVKWLEGARDVYNLTIHYIGIWNERSSDATYAVTLRAAMDAAGFQHTQIVAKDGGADICTHMAKDPAYAKAVSVIGLHYPSDFYNYAACHSFNKPLWASEESSSFDDANGAACWARVINSHWVLQQMTSSIMWNLIGSYYHGTNWYAESMMTAVQPWSRHYQVSPVIWATAHVTQFTEVGWQYLKNGAGSGELPEGGYYVTWIDPKSLDFTVVVVKISHEHASCIRPRLPDFNVAAETVAFALDSSLGNASTLQVWYSNFEDGPPYTTFEKKQPIAVKDGHFSLLVPVGGMFTLTTITTGSKGHYDAPSSSPSFPLPYGDNFDSYNQSGEARYFSDQIGIFEIHPATADRANHGNVMRQMVPVTPIAWQGWSNKGPLTVIGMREWQDVSVSVDFFVPDSLVPLAAVCVATRSDQFWTNAITLCVHNITEWQLADSGPQLSKADVEAGIHGGGSIRPRDVLGHGTLSGTMSLSHAWHRLTLTTVDNKASGLLDGKHLFSNTTISNLDTGFAGFGLNGWYGVEFDNFNISQAGDNWLPESPCRPAKIGDALNALRCTTNGMMTHDQQFELLPTYQLRHYPSGLCATSNQTAPGAVITLQPCQAGNASQLFLNIYSNIRNFVQPLTQGSLSLSGSTSRGEVSLQAHGTSGYWTEWVYFPNTEQLRNQYTRDESLGYPRCLSTCPLSF